MPYPRTIDDYYRSVLEEAKKEINSTADDRILGTADNEWLAYLETRFGMSPIAFDSSRQPEMVEVNREYTLRRDDVYSGLPAGTKRRETAIAIQMPVQPSATIQAIWSHKLAPNPFSMSLGRHPKPAISGQLKTGHFQ
jgi:hypothetical protein